MPPKKIREQPKSLPSDRYRHDQRTRSVERAAMASEASIPHHIIVVGGGAGGLELATRLGDKLGRRKLADVTLIDRSRSHLWKPLLHEIAAGTMDLGVHEIDFLAQAHWHHFRYRVGEMIGLDRARREVWLAPHVGHQPTDRAADVADDARRKHIRHGGLCCLRVGKSSWPLCSTPRAGSAPAGHASRQANQATAGRHTAAAVALS